MIVIEIQPLNNTQHKLHIFISHEKIPTYRSFDFYTKVSNLPKNESMPDFKFNYWFLNNSMLLNRTGRWFINVMELGEDLSLVIIPFWCGFICYSKFFSRTKLQTRHLTNLKYPIWPQTTNCALTPLDVITWTKNMRSGQVWIWMHKISDILTIILSMSREGNVCSEHILRGHHVPILAHDALWGRIFCPT